MRMTGNETWEKQMSPGINTPRVASHHLRADLDNPVVANPDGDVPLDDRRIIFPDQCGSRFDDTISMRGPRPAGRPILSGKLGLRRAPGGEQTRTKSPTHHAPKCLSPRQP